MADNTVANLPTKNAAPAEPAKSLQATVQQVMTKAVTSPTDAKVDFAQGVNHITGDPQQKSAGPADAMPTLSAEKEPKKDIQAAYEADEKKDEKEKEDMKEAEHADKKDDEKKDVKEGEMPAGLKKYLDKKNDKEDEKSEEKEDDKKKDMKEAEDKEDKKKDEKEMSEAEDKEDKKEKEVSESEDKEKEAKKEMTAKDKVKDMDMKEDVAALTDGEELSEEFKQKASTIFEAAVKAKLVEEIENLESEYETKVDEKVSEVKEEIVDKVDAYLNYDVIDNQAAEIEKLKEEVNKTIEKNVELNSKLAESTREEVINDVSSDLVATEVEKLKGLAESIEYKDADSFRKSIETLKNSYFPKAKASDNESNEVAENNAGLDLSESMAAYTAAISKTKKNPYLK